MQDAKKKRGINWSPEEKVLLREIISLSAEIIENKSTKTSMNLKKSKEWKNITNKFNEISNTSRSESELKLAWKRMKLAAKANLSAHRIEQQKTGGGEKPPSPSPEDLQILSIAPQDFLITINDYDSDAVLPTTTPQLIVSEISAPNKTPDRDPVVAVTPAPVMAGPSWKPDINNEQPEPSDVMDSDISKANKEEKNAGAKKIIAKKKKNTLPNRNDELKKILIESNKDFKKRQLEMMEEEHNLNMKIANLKIKKLELEISILEDRKINLE